MNALARSERLKSMALTSIGYELSVTFQGIDSSGASVQRTKLFEIAPDPLAVDANDELTRALGDAQQLITELDDFTESDIVGYRFTQKFEESTTPTAVANPYKEAVMTMALNNAGTKKGTLTIPAPKDAVLINGRTVDENHADVTALLALFKATGGLIRISDGESIRDTDPMLASRVRAVASGKNY